MKAFLLLLLSGISASWRLSGDEQEVQIDDMIFSKEQYRKMYTTSKIKEGAFRAGVGNSDLKWNNGEMPYIIDKKFTKAQRGAIKKAIRKFNGQMAGCLKLRAPRKTDTHKITFKKVSRGCSSKVGKVSRSQSINLSDGCFSIGNKRTITHEIIHAFGFTHEQNRNDRHKHVNIIWENIKHKHWNNFKKRPKLYVDYTKEYDPKSIMHYRSTTFAKRPGLTTIESTNDQVPNEMLGGDEMTYLDKKKLRMMYNCRL